MNYYDVLEKTRAVPEYIEDEHEIGVPQGYRATVESALNGGFGDFTSKKNLALIVGAVVLAYMYYRTL